jgi:hypothetical protein
MILAGYNHAIQRKIRKYERESRWRGAVLKVENVLERNFSEPVEERREGVWTEVRKLRLTRENAKLAISESREQDAQLLPAP